MENTPTPKKRKAGKILKIILWIGILLIVIAGGLFAYGYFQYGKIIRTMLIEAVNRESKGLYRAEIGSLYLNVLAGNLTLKDLELIPDTALYRKGSDSLTFSPLMLRLKVGQFRVVSFNIWDAIRNRKIDISAIRIKSPEITLFRMKPSRQAREDKPAHRIMSIPLPKGLISICIREIEFDRGKLDFYDLSGDSVIHQSVPSCSVMIRNILVDSSHQGKKRLFNADDISITVNDIEMKTKNGLNKILLGEIGLSTGSNLLYVKGFHLAPLFSRHDYTRKLGFQTDRMDIYVGRIDVNRLNFRELILGGKFMAGLVAIDSLLLDNYRDKRVPRRPGFKPAMPQDGIRKLKAYLKIDTVLLKNGKASYAEQVNQEPGTIYFDKMEGMLTGLTNDSSLLNAGLVSVLKGTAWLMGKGRLDATVRFRFGDKRNSFSFSANLGSIDLREINPMLTKLLPAEVISGKVNRLEMPMVTANDDVATGKLLFYYHDLSIAVTSEKKSTWTSIKKGVVNFVANDLIVNDANPTKSGKMKTGMIYFRRDKEKGIINFVWKSALSGLKSTMGFNSKEQKALIKAEGD